MKTCAFTGHRPQNLLWQFNEADTNCLKMKQILNQQISQLVENGFRFLFFIRDILHYILNLTI